MNTLAKTRPGSGGSGDPGVVGKQTLKRLATRYLTMQSEIHIIEQQLSSLVRQINPLLLSLSGVGPATAATLLVAAGDNPDRLRTRATFAALSPVLLRSPPLQASAHGIGSLVAGTGTRTPPCIGSSCCACVTESRGGTTEREGRRTA